MSIPDLMMKNLHEYERFSEDLLTKMGEGIKSFILLKSEIDEARKRAARAEFDVERKPSTEKDVSTKGEDRSDIEVVRKDDPIQGLKNVTGTPTVAKTGDDAIQQRKDNQAKSDSIIYLRDNLEPGVPVLLEDGTNVMSTVVSDGIIEIEIEKDGQKQSIGKVSETGLVAVSPSYSNEQLEKVQELIDYREFNKSTQLTQETQESQITQEGQTDQENSTVAIGIETTSVESESIQTQVTKNDLNNLHAYLYSDEYKSLNPSSFVSRSAANKTMQPYQQKYMKKARQKYGKDITSRDIRLSTEQFEIDIAPEDAAKISIANEWAAREQTKEKHLEQEKYNSISR